MAETAILSLPLLEAAQAQKHVTVNAALMRLDASVQLRLLSIATATPPGFGNDGDAYGVPIGATGDWAGRTGQVAVFSNGGWDYLEPVSGWQAWIVTESAPAIYDDGGWLVGAASVSQNGAGALLRVVEVDHVIGAGATSTTGALILSGASVLGVTGRVTDAITGTLTAWRLGIAGVSDDRYGAGIGLGQGSWMRGVTGSPLAYYADTALTLTAEGGDFASGTVRLAVHLLELSLPRA